MSPAPNLPEPQDMSHHLTENIRAQKAGAMKAYAKLLSSKNLLSLAGGMPHASLFPMQHATFTLPALASLTGDVASWQQGTAATATAHLKKVGPGTEAAPSGVLDLNVVLQYGLTNGFPGLIDKLERLNELLHGRVHADHAVFLTLGNTDGVSKTFSLFVEPGDYVLAEEYSFSSSLNSGRAKGAKFYPVKVDGDGLVPEDLERVLSTWDTDALGKKPHLLYTIPVGQNPTGSVQPAERYDAIYAICSKHDVIIMEDDPYYPLQYTAYEPNPTTRAANLAAARARMPTVPATAAEDSPQTVADVFNSYAGIASYLSRDVDGRVVRIDTFSKVFGPGMRLGWISASSALVERLMRIGETSTQVPNNLAQAVVASYLDDSHWGLGGWIRWIWGVRLEYQAKRDFFLDKLVDYVDQDVVETVPAMGGMFQWLKINLEAHPRFKVEADGTSNTGALMDELWEGLVKQDEVLLMPARLFQVEGPGEDSSGRLNYFRATFAGDLDTIDAALKRFGDGLKGWLARG